MVVAQHFRQAHVPKASKHILITGASAGIGEALSRQLAPTAAISAIARRKDKLKQLCSEFPNITAYNADVADKENLAKQLDKAILASGDIDVAILNAGIYQPVSALDFDASIYQRHMDVNYMGIIHCLESIIPNMLKAGQGHIMVMASVAGYRGLPKSAAYGPTKAALQNLAECLYFDLNPKNVKIQLVNPGFVETDATSVNDFKMPGLMSSEQAAHEIIKGMESTSFEIAFPRGFTRFMKCASILPYDIYLKMAARFTKGQ